MEVSLHAESDGTGPFDQVGAKAFRMARPMDAKFRERGCLLGLGSLHKAGAGTFPPLGIQNLCSHLRMPPRVTTVPFLSHGCRPSKAQVPSRLSPQSSVALASLTTIYAECRLPFPLRSQRTRTYLNTSQCGGQTTVSITEEAFRLICHTVSNYSSGFLHSKRAVS